MKNWDNYEVGFRWGRFTVQAEKSKLIYAVFNSKEKAEKYLKNRIKDNVDNKIFNG